MMSSRLSSPTLLCLVMWSASSNLPAAEKVERKVIHSQSSVVLTSADVSVAITERGGHMAPVTFFPKSDRPVQPYHISPWQDEKLTFDVPVLGPLRGDFSAFRSEEIPTRSTARNIRRTVKSPGVTGR
jgi:hypothetical protein